MIERGGSTGDIIGTRAAACDTRGTGRARAGRCLVATLSLLLPFGGAAAHAEPGSATWTAYLYEGPGWHYSVISEVFQGQRFDVLGCADKWCKITYERNVGFVPAEVVVKGSESAYKPPPGVLAQPAAQIVPDPKGPCFPANQKGGNGGNAMTWFCAK